VRNAYLDKLIELRNAQEAFATATIVRRRIPSSGKPGDHAIITADGTIHGWIGGGCTRGIVLKEALLAIKERKARFVTISPEQRKSTFTNTKIYAMPCQSGGEVEVYIEPVLPKPALVIFGTSHIAMALAKVARAIDYRVTCFVNNVDKNVFENVPDLRDIKTFEKSPGLSKAYVVVCTQGEGDAEALEKAISLYSPYTAFVASFKKADAIIQELINKGVDKKALSQLKTPAGLDIKAKEPEEVAISILAQIIKHHRTECKSAKGNTASADLLAGNKDYYLNPVCNIPIQKSTAKHIIEHAIVPICNRDA